MLLMSTVTLLGVHLFLPETHPKAKRQALNARTLLRNYWRIFSTPQFQLLAGAGAFAFSGLFLYIAVAPSYVLKHLGLQETEFAWLFGAFITGLVSSALISSRLAGRISLSKQMRIGIAIVLNNREDSTIRALYSWMKAHLAEHKMPVRWWVVEEIPRTSRGKINRDAVKAACVKLESIDLTRVLAGEKT